jgi:hypothetical protein
MKRSVLSGGRIPASVFGENAAIFFWPLRVERAHQLTQDWQGDRTLAQQYFFVSDLHMGGDGQLQHCDYATEFIAFLKELETQGPDTELLIFEVRTKVSRFAEARRSRQREFGLVVTSLEPR